MQYYAFFTGQAGGSTTADLQSGLLRPWDYFYNSGGWDDYPPQKAVHEQRLEKRCTPVVTTAHAVRCARILAYTAHLLAHGAVSYTHLDVYKRQLYRSARCPAPTMIAVICFAITDRSFPD